MADRKQGFALASFLFSLENWPTGYLYGCQMSSCRVK